jgi:hypothetical protein
MGHLISAGTGLTQFKSLAVEEPESENEVIIEALDALELAAQQAAADDQEAVAGEAEASAG